jgi:hypothetical protein
MKENRILISKIDSARRQLETAIKFFFADGDFVSIHALSYAAFTIARNLSDRTRSPESFKKWLGEHFHESHHQEMFRRINEAGNFLKHADRDPKAILEYIPNQYEIFMALAMKEYEAITHEMALPMHVFKVWFLMNHPSWLIDENIKKRAPQDRKQFPANRRQFYEEVSRLLIAADSKIIGT